jgi:hypothetical protein
MSKKQAYYSGRPRRPLLRPDLSYLVIREGRPRAVIFDPSWYEMFWTRYTFDALSDDPTEREFVHSPEFWDPNDKVVMGYEYVNCQSGIRAEGAFLGGNQTVWKGYVTIRALRIPTWRSTTLLGRILNPILHYFGF